MLRVEVRGIEAVKRRLQYLRRELQPKALQPALNRVAEKARAEINRAIPQEYHVKAAEVRNAVELRRARSGSLEAVISVFGSARKRGRSMNLVHFLNSVVAAGRALKVRGGKGRKAELARLEGQLGFLIKRGGGMKKIRGAFVGNRGRTIFARVGEARLPIKPLQVIGFAQMFRSRKIERRIMDKIAADLPLEVERAIRMVLARAGS